MAIEVETEPACHVARCNWHGPELRRALAPHLNPRRLPSTTVVDPTAIGRKGVRRLLQWGVFLVLLCGPLSQAQAQGRLSFESLGPAGVNADPAILNPAAQTGEAQELIGDTADGTWWRGRLIPGPEASDPDLPLVVSFKGSYSSALTLWHPETGWRVERQRFRHPGPNWASGTDHLVVVPSALRDGGTFYVHVQDATHRRIRPRLQPLEQYLADVASQRDVTIGSAAALITLALLALVFVNSMGNTAYRQLAMMACMAAGYLLTLNGDFFRLVRIDLLFEYGIAVNRTFGTCAIAFSHFFIIAFLGLKARRPRAAVVLALLAWAQIGIGAVSWLEGVQPRPLGALITNMLLLIGVPTVLWEAWVAHRQGVRAGRFVLWAWSPALLLLALWVFALQDWLPRAAVDLGSLVSIGLAIQVAVLVFGLADDSARLRNERDTATRDAEHDALTGALNRRALQRCLLALHEKGGREANPCSLVFLDLDHFKRINDIHGHAAGDQCLRQLVNRLGHQKRSGDLLARIGGEEFVLVLQGMEGASAAARAEALRQHVAAEPFSVDNQRIHLTTSFGVAEWRAGESPESAMQRADQALYRAKSEGRNRIVLDLPADSVALALPEGIA